MTERLDAAAELLRAHGWSVTPPHEVPSGGVHFRPYRSPRGVDTYIGSRPPRLDYAVFEAWRAIRPALSTPTIRRMSHSGFTPDDAAYTPDFALLGVRGIGPVALAEIRAAIPYQG